MAEWLDGMHPRLVDHEAVARLDQRAIYVTRGKHAGYLLPLPHSGMDEATLLLFARILAGDPTADPRAYLDTANAGGYVEPTVMFVPVPFDNKAEPLEFYPDMVKYRGEFNARWRLNGLDLVPK